MHWQGGWLGTILLCNILTLALKKLWFCNITEWWEAAKWCICDWRVSFMPTYIFTFFSLNPKHAGQVAGLRAKFGFVIVMVGVGLTYIKFQLKMFWHHWFKWLMKTTSSSYELINMTLLRACMFKSSSQTEPGTAVKQQRQHQMMWIATIPVNESSCTRSTEEWLRSTPGVTRDMGWLDYSTAPLLVNFQKLAQASCSNLSINFTLWCVGYV